MYYIDIDTNIYIFHNNTIYTYWFNESYKKYSIDVSFVAQQICANKQYIILSDKTTIFIYNVSASRHIIFTVEKSIKYIYIVSDLLYIIGDSIVKYNIPSIFSGISKSSIYDTPGQTGVCSVCKPIDRDGAKHLFCPPLIYELPNNCAIINAQFGKYYNYIEYSDGTAYISGTNYFKHFGNILEFHVDWHPIQSSMIFSDKISIKLHSDRIQIFGKVNNTITTSYAVQQHHISIMNNSIAFIEARPAEPLYDLHIYSLENAVWNRRVFPLDVEIFFQGIEWIRLNTCGVLIKLLHSDIVLLYNTVLNSCCPVLSVSWLPAAKPVLSPAFPVSCQPVSLSSSNHSAFHTVWYDSSHVYHIGRSCHNIIQNIHEIRNIQCNSYNTSYLFNNGACITVSTTGELDIEQYPFHTIKIVCGNEHYVALANDGTVWIKGDNSYGQLGINTYSTIEDWHHLTSETFIDNAQNILAAISMNKTPTQLSADSRYIIDIYTGVDTTFFIAKDYSIYVCGCNTTGQLGIGTQFNRKQPTRLNRFAGILTAAQDRIDSIAGGRDFTVFLTQAGDVYIAGYSQYLFPHKIASNIQQIAVGLDHYILLDKAGTATTNGGATIENCRQVIAGAQHSIFITEHSILATGANSYGQCTPFKHIQLDNKN
jgi:hypothetical protein